ncbi:MAG: phosphatase PAP2 family protein [Thermoprotei archaeon]
MVSSRFSRALVYMLLLLSIVETAGVFSGNIGFGVIASRVGESAFYLVLAVFIYCFFSGDKGLFLISGLGLTASFTVLLKTVLKMPRPPESEWLINAEGPGFPSGHAAMSFSFALLVFFATRDKVLGLALFIHAISVSYSRVLLHVHYPIDVIGGAILGLLFSYITYTIYRRLGRQYGKYLVLIGLFMSLTSIVSSIEMPEYTDAPLLTGVSFGVVLSGVVMDTYKDEYLLRRDMVLRFISLVIGFTGLASVLVLESMDSYITILIGGFIFALLVFLSRPLASKLVKP